MHFFVHTCLLYLLLPLVNSPSLETGGPLRPTSKLKPRVCLSFDDGSLQDMPGYSHQEWNQRLLDHLKREGVQAAFLVAGKALDNPAGHQLLSTWDQAGHLLGNHTYSYFFYHSDSVSYERFATDFLKNDSLLRPYAHFKAWFRFPYLKEGNTVQKRDRFRGLLQKRGYQNAHVTIDASDWYINARLVTRLRQDPKADLRPYRAYYLQHLLDRASYYNQLALELTGRRVAHTLLLHHNLTSALFVGDLIAYLKAQGWEVIHPEEAFGDPLYQHKSQTLPAGESLIWSMARESGRYEGRLRYPAEDSRYEEVAMNQLGL